MSLYYYSDDKGIQGPFTISELAQKGISPLSAVKPEGGSWQNAGDIPALALLFPELQREYFYARDDEHRGPFKLEVLQRAALLPSDLVWYKGLGDWVRADTLPELQPCFQYLEDRPPPIPRSTEPAPQLVVAPFSREDYEQFRKFRDEEAGEAFSILAIFLVVILILALLAFFISFILPRLFS